MGRRDQVLAAAVKLLAESSGRQFTHRAVDAAAGVPVGTTSNFFRTRRELMWNTYDHVAARMAEYSRPLVKDTPSDARALSDQLGAFLRVAWEERRDEIVAQCALTFESMHDDELADRMTVVADGWLDRLTGILHGLGAADARTGARMLSTYLLALLFSQLAAPDPEFDPARSIEPLVLGLTTHDR